MSLPLPYEQDLIAQASIIVAMVPTPFAWRLIAMVLVPGAVPLTRAGILAEIMLGPCWTALRRAASPIDTIPDDASVGHPTVPCPLDEAFIAERGRKATCVRNRHSQSCARGQEKSPGGQKGANQPYLSMHRDLSFVAGIWRRLPVPSYLPHPKNLLTIYRFTKHLCRYVCTAAQEHIGGLPYRIRSLPQFSRAPCSASSNSRRVSLRRRATMKIARPRRIGPPMMTIAQSHPPTMTSLLPARGGLWVYSGSNRRRKSLFPRPSPA